MELPPGDDLDDAIAPSALLDRLCAEIGRDSDVITRSLVLPVSYDQPRATRAAVAAAVAAGFGHIVLALPAPYPTDAARWVTDKIITTPHPSPLDHQRRGMSANRSPGPPEHVVLKGPHQGPNVSEAARGRRVGRAGGLAGGDRAQRGWDHPGGCARRHRVRSRCEAPTLDGVGVTLRNVAPTDK